MKQLLLLLSLCLFTFSCERKSKGDVVPEIITYSVDDLIYPENAIDIPDSFSVTFKDNYFLPWQASKQALLNSIETFPGKDLAYLNAYLEDDEWYGENKKPHQKWQRQAVVDNIDLSDFPNFNKKGIVISHTDLRRLPTQRPGFDRYSKAGEGFPFDYFQETNLWANTPVYLLHRSRDKQWCYVISPYYKGWVSMHDMAVVDDDFIAQWSTSEFCLPLTDALVLADERSNYAVNAKIGMVLPYEENEAQPDEVVVYYAVSDAYQNANILKASVNKSEVAFDTINFDATSVKGLVTNLLGQPYGWGGNLENRDCSSMIRDMMGTYRIWLPRDSKDQMNVGQNYELTGTAQQKIEIIKDKGTPYFTILRKSGHNMLYVGNDSDGDPLILHAIWGLKPYYTDDQLADYIKTYPVEGLHQDEDGKIRGRYVIGETVITSVKLGSNHDNLVSIIDQIYAMTNFMED